MTLFTTDQKNLLDRGQSDRDIFGCSETIFPCAPITPSHHHHTVTPSHRHTVTPHHTTTPPHHIHPVHVGHSSNLTGASWVFTTCARQRNSANQLSRQPTKSALEHALCGEGLQSRDVLSRQRTEGRCFQRGFGDCVSDASQRQARKRNEHDNRWLCIPCSRENRDG